MRVGEKTIFDPTENNQTLFTVEISCKYAIRQHRKWLWWLKQHFRVPELVWDYLSMYTTRLQCCTVEEDNERSGLEEVTWVRSDISEWIDFHFYEPIKYYQVTSYPGMLRNWASGWGCLRILTRVYAMSSWRRMTRQLTGLESHPGGNALESEKQKTRVFKHELENLWGSRSTIPLSSSEKVSSQEMMKPRRMHPGHWYPATQLGTWSRYRRQHLIRNSWKTIW